MTKHEVNEAFEQQACRWLEKKGIPYQRYKNLPDYYKVVLHNLVCIPTHTTTYDQRKNLYKKLCLSDIAGRESIDPADFMPDEELRKFFSPLTPSGRLHDLEKY